MLKFANYRNMHVYRKVIQSDTIKIKRALPLTQREALVKLSPVVRGETRAMKRLFTTNHS